MIDLTTDIRNCAPYRHVLEALREGRDTAAEDLWGASAALLMAALAEDMARPCLCILPGVEDAERFAEDVRFFAPDRLTYFPAWENLEGDEEPDVDIASERLALIRQLLAPEGVKGDGYVIVAPTLAVLQHAADADDIQAHSLNVSLNEEHAPGAIAEWLVDQGFRSVYQVEVPGEFCRRGGILDVYPYGSPLPYRLEFFGDTVDSIRTFSPGTQSSDQTLQRCDIIAPAALARDARDRGHNIIDCLPATAWVAVKEPLEVAARADSPEYGLAEGRGAKRLAEATDRLTKLDIAALPTGRPAHRFETKSVARFEGRLQTALSELEALCERTRRTVVLCNNQAEAERFRELVAGSPLATSDTLETRLGHVNAGFEAPEIGLALVPHHELFNRYQQRRTPPTHRHTTFIASHTDVSPGDYVVHLNHGIGLYRGTKIMEHAGNREESLCIEYRDGAMLYVPATHIEMVQKYIGPSEHRPELSMLGGKAWTSQKARAAASAEELAVDMLQMQADRATQKGIAFREDPTWQREFETAFLYQETEDQLQVAEAVRQDMMSERPMDRLICGDVGYGKTEVAMRAAFRAVTHGAQVAVLVPTTVLAAQHHRTFRERMADYPVRVELLCRFRTRGEQREIIEDMKAGSVDIVVGTHRLVQNDVGFKNLGLLIIDEEQRFGVEAKEKLKRYRTTVDLLTLTATPIPRTLHMALLGIKDISSLNTPPRDRLAIQTRLMRFDEQKIRRIILRELQRDGQVFFVHNRVFDIDGLAVRLQKLVPEARMTVGHGQMPERQLERRMRRFVAREADVLVCTTIIESGLDIPNANTMIIHRADEYGLAEMHQLRGRVGRYKHRAYCYLLLPENRPVNPVAQRRLKAIQEYSELGAGFRIAMRDLELRGAGNILGPEQSGHIAAVGYELYCRLLEHAVQRGTGKRPTPDHPVTISLGLDTFIPDTYMPDARHRIDVYRRLSRASGEETIEEIVLDMRDRFGTPPEQVDNLVDESRLRVRARAAGVRRIGIEDGQLQLQTLDMARTHAALKCSPERRVELDDHTLLLRLPTGRQIPPAEYVLYLKNVLLPDEH